MKDTYKMKSLILYPLLVLSLAVGCAHRLQPGGAYAPAVVTVVTNADGTVVTTVTSTATPDYPFYVADAAYDLARSAIDAAFRFEYDNRTNLWRISKSIKKTLDGIRVNATEADMAYLKARRTYLANPIGPNLTVLQEALARLQALASAATAALPQEKGK